MTALPASLESHAHEASQRGDQALALLLHEAAGRVRELEQTIENDGYLLIAGAAALNSSYDAMVWPANGTSVQELVRDKIRGRLKDGYQLCKSLNPSPTPATTKG